ncbi:PIG-L family deacetylase [Nocardia macrotermitis]|uniref:Mycothiol S-conjugate amidase n=1 Tax=Nocardia macrotermitis TaxID=2585198 RepID=A0A7K0DCJ0_9NOCA|nr:PIG-L family deacetylase [Nocardia macrotermitis]MQY22594.1 Mycothiol S-conjugate amidase [Nocardia macrotermitis]
MAEQLTIMAVHAHPDDEVISTGGVFARYTAEGIRTVLVTCTNGEQGDAPGGIKPGEPGHDPNAVRAQRLSELQESAALLGIEHVELLGYRDSGMDGWDGNNDPEAFTNIPVDQAAARLADLIRHYRPQVVLTYDENGNYGHPDHIQANRIAVAATTETGIPAKLYYTAIPREASFEVFAELRARGLTDLEPPADFGTPMDRITAVIDVSEHAQRKVKALEAHASQSDSVPFLQMPTDLQQLFFGTESFTRQLNRTPDAPDHETDLFAGLR